jgi:hypothetical protein
MLICSALEMFSRPPKTILQIWPTDIFLQLVNMLQVNMLHVNMLHVQELCK